MKFGKLNTVKLVSMIHLGWGSLALIFYFTGVPFPRPFGSQEAFLVYMPSWLMGLIMVIGAVLCRIALYLKEPHPYFAVWTVLPQQIILMWSTVWGLFHLTDGDINGDFDSRGALALVYLFALSGYHATDVAELWARARLARLKHGRTTKSR